MHCAAMPACRDDGGVTATSITFRPLVRNDLTLLAVGSRVRTCGTRILSQFVSECFALPEVGQLAIDPDPDSASAQALYRKIGFEPHGGISQIRVLPRASRPRS